MLIWWVLRGFGGHADSLPPPRRACRTTWDNNRGSVCHGFDDFEISHNSILLPPFPRFPAVARTAPE